MMEEPALLRPQLSLFEAAPVALDEYQQWTKLTDQNRRSDTEGLGFTLLGLFGEVGSLLSELKKKQRDQDSYVAYRASVIEELGDVLWYFANSALRAGLSLSEIAARAESTLGDWHYQGRAEPKTFPDLQNPAGDFTGPLSTDLVETRLFALAGKVGRLIEHYGQGEIASNLHQLNADLLEVFRQLVLAADEANVSLDEAARRNLAKTIGRWPTPELRKYGAHYDSEYDEDERLPRLIEMTFSEKDLQGKKYVIQKCKGLHIGDRLTDNKLEEDDYRFMTCFIWPMRPFWVGLRS